MMTKFYAWEVDRRIVGLCGLNNILSLHNHKKLMTNYIGTVLMDHYNGPHRVALCIVVFKNELTGNSQIDGSS